METPAASASAPAPSAEVTPTTAPVAAAPVTESKPSLSTFAATLVASVKSKITVAAELAAANQKIATLTTERDTARASVITVTAERDAATAQCAELAAYFGISAADISGKKPAELRALIDAHVSAVTADQIAAMGVPQSGLPKQQPAAETAPAVNKTLTGRERYKADFNRQLAARFGRN